MDLPSDVSDWRWLIAFGIEKSLPISFSKEAYPFRTGRHHILYKKSDRSRQKLMGASTKSRLWQSTETCPSRRAQIRREMSMLPFVTPRLKLCRPQEILAWGR